MKNILDKYKKTFTIRFKIRDMYNLNRIKYFWEKDSNEKYTYSEIIRMCLEIVCSVEDEIRIESNKTDR